MSLFSSNNREKVLNLGLFSISLIPIILYVYVISQRISLPFDLEWGEGAGINQIFRILSGEKLYVAPTLEFAPLVYTPFYYWLSALLSKTVLRLEVAARLISVLASFGSAGILAWLVIKETSQRLTGWLTAALFLACFSLSGGFYDLIRVDSLYIFSLLAGFLILSYSTKVAGKITAGLVIALGFYIKQSAPIVFIPVLLFLLIKDWKSNWPIPFAIITGISIPFFWINDLSGGWFKYYIFGLPQEHGYSIVSAINFWIGDLTRPLGIAIGFGLAYLFIRLQELSVEREQKTKNEISEENSLKVTETNQAGPPFFALFALGAIGTGWITRASNGGGPNNVISAYAAISLLFGLGFSKVKNLLKKKTIPESTLPVLIFCLVAIQFVGLTYNPFNFLPTPAEIEANEILMDSFIQAEGPIWAPYRSHLPHLAGKSTSIHAVNLFELTGYFKGQVLPEGKDLVQQIRRNICNQDYDLIVLDQPIIWVEEQLLVAYQPGDRFNFLESEKRSSLLKWQGGFEAFYEPQLEYDKISCLSTISAEETK